MDWLARGKRTGSNPHFDDEVRAAEVEAEQRTHERIGDLAERLATLTDEERQCFELHSLRDQELDDVLRSRLAPAAYDALVRLTRTRTTANGRRYIARLGYDAIARVTRLTTNQVRQRCLTAHRKMHEPVTTPQARSR